MTGSQKRVRLNGSEVEKLDELKDSQSLSSYSSAVRFLFEERSMNMYLRRFDHSRVDPVQPLEGTTLPKAIAYCPICGDAVARFHFTESDKPDIGLPAFLHDGIFFCNSEDCRADNIPEELRHSHHLVAGQLKDERPTDEEMEATLTSYWDSVLPAENMEPSEREFRVTSWAGLAKACGWKWRPPLSLWREFASLEEIMHSVGLLLDDQVGIEGSTIAPDSGCCATKDWHFHIATPNMGQASGDTQSEQSQILSDAVTLVEEWLSDSSVEVEVSDEGGQQSLLFHGI